MVEVLKNQLVLSTALVMDQNYIQAPKPSEWNLCNVLWCSTENV